MANGKVVDPRHHHRERVRKDFLLHGLEDYEPHRVLELLLFYAVPRKDTKPIAYRLMAQFDSLNAVFDAPIEQLEKIEGISTSSAILIKMIPQLAKRYYVGSIKKGKPLNNANDLFEYLAPYFIGESTECVYLLTLDTNMRPVACRKLSQGVSATEVNLFLVQVTREAATTVHANFVLAHNHPDGEQLMPSRADELLTKQINKALINMDKKLYDHIIISGDEYFSFLQNFGRISD